MIHNKSKSLDLEGLQESRSALDQRVLVMQYAECSAQAIPLLALLEMAALQRFATVGNLIAHVAYLMPKTEPPTPP